MPAEGRLSSSGDDDGGDHGDDDGGDHGDDDLGGDDKIASVGVGCWSGKGVKQMAPFVLLCLNSPNCYALFVVSCCCCC